MFVPYASAAATSNSCPVQPSLMDCRQSSFTLICKASLSMLFQSGYSIFWSSSGRERTYRKARAMVAHPRIGSSSSASPSAQNMSQPSSGIVRRRNLPWSAFPSLMSTSDWTQANGAASKAAMSEGNIFFHAFLNSGRFFSKIFLTESSSEVLELLEKSSSTPPDRPIITRSKQSSFWHTLTRVAPKIAFPFLDTTLEAPPFASSGSPQTTHPGGFDFVGISCE
mmetsp:Transcript_45816/g.115365  ORF Transcript_45816/g.115365 Transcript_45816/m.115365 type:complete len:224 (+) Transcript_45816:2885-3556(+)